MDSEKLGMTAPEDDSESVELKEVELVNLERFRVRVTRPSSTLHGLIGEGFRVVLNPEETAAEGDFFDPTPLYWVRFDRETFPRQGWFEECEVEILPPAEEAPKQ